MDLKESATDTEYRTDDEKAASSQDEIESVLGEEHREYLLQRHGTLDLDPMPSADPADPYNWSKPKKIINLALVAFHAMMATFIAAGIAGVLLPISLDLNVSILRASYLLSLVIAILGGAPLLWRPLANRYGRRPIFLISLLFSIAGNIGCAKSPNYATMGLCRAIAGFFISPAAAIGSAVVSETFFKRERATYMGVWTIMVTCGVPIGPFLFGFLAQRADYRWIYWILAMINGVQFVLYFFFGSETLYMRTTDSVVKSETPTTIASYFNFRRIDPSPLTLASFTHPFRYFLRPRVCLPAIAYAMVFMWSFVLPSILIPQVFPVTFRLDPQQTGLQFLSFIIGSLIGEQLGGRASDWWMRRRQRVLGPGQAPPPEYRLWLSYPGFALSIIGTVVFLVQIQHLGTKWNVTPLVGAAIAAAGNQLVTTVLITYAVDCYREDSAAVGVFIVFVRQTWGFIGPFWWTHLIDKVNYTGTAGVGVGFIVVFSVLPIIWLQASYYKVATSS
ncbi:major facilitator superfamily domain-containing protein [Roridomyces roridus]|uniref:Major facilitator superfamily domain-containing protein n=1 Tax=Roridomyces roridus TaxID=1738132 RepID=A0AAD7B4G9_9AGAR|nr:major facilitator superfamily domain-containing protein [Roridomyces roridus]